MARVEVGNVNADPINFNDMTLRADLTDLDNIYDVVLLSFIYGQQSDLSDGVEIAGKKQGALFETNGSVTGDTFTSSYDTWVDLPHQNLKDTSVAVDNGSGTTYTEGTDYELNLIEGKIKVLSTGSMSDSTSYNISYDYGHNTAIIDSLAEGTEYFYQAKATAISYNSEECMEIATDSSGFMSDLAYSEPAITELLDIEMARTKLFNSEPALRGVANSPLVDIFYSSDYNSMFLNSFWETQVGDVTVNDDNISIYTDTDAETSITSIPLDLTNKNSLIIDWGGNGTAVDNNYIAEVIIDNTAVISKDKPEEADRSEDTIDISDYSGEQPITVKVSDTLTNGYYEVEFLIYSMYLS